jgi:hypothetical protein
MAVHYLPDIRQAVEHKALQRLVEHYPADRYDEWRYLQSKKIADLRAAGHKVRLVPITANDFVEYCDRTGARLDISTFTGFLWDKGKRHRSR